MTLLKILKRFYKNVVKLSNGSKQCLFVFKGDGKSIDMFSCDINNDIKVLKQKWRYWNLVTTQCGLNAISKKKQCGLNANITDVF